MTTMEEARTLAEGYALAENTLSSIKLIKNSKGYTWEIKVKEIDVYKALEITEQINEMLRQKYDTMQIQKADT